MRYDLISSFIRILAVHSLLNDNFHCISILCGTLLKEGCWMAANLRFLVLGQTAVHGTIFLATLRIIFKKTSQSLGLNIDSTQVFVGTSYFVFVQYEKPCVKM